MLQRATSTWQLGFYSTTNNRHPKTISISKSHITDFETQLSTATLAGISADFYKAPRVMRNENENERKRPAVKNASFEF
jgi:hypothetical protein